MVKLVVDIYLGKDSEVDNWCSYIFQGQEDAHILWSSGRK